MSNKVQEIVRQWLAQQKKILGRKKYETLNENTTPELPFTYHIEWLVQSVLAIFFLLGNFVSTQ